jgi:hypothetical protein
MHVMCRKMIGAVEKGQLPMMDILKKGRSTRRLLIENIYEIFFGKSPGITIGKLISERVMEAMTGIKNSCLCGITFDRYWVIIPSFF